MSNEHSNKILTHTDLNGLTINKVQSLLTNGAKLDDEARYCLDQAIERVEKFVYSYAEVLSEEFIQIDELSFSEELTNAVKDSSERFVASSVGQFKDTQIMIFPSDGLQNKTIEPIDEIKEQYRDWIVLAVTPIVDTVKVDYNLHGPFVLGLIPLALDRASFTFPDGNFEILDFQSEFSDS